MTSNEPATVPPELAATVGAQLKASLENPDSPMTAEAIVAMVLDGVNQVQAGDPLGTVRRDPETGVVYVRVNDGGVHKWRIVNPDDGGANAFDMRALTHPVISAPEAS